MNRRRSSEQGEIPEGMLSMIVDKIVQMDDLKALEDNTMSMSRALARYEIQKENEIEDRRKRQFQQLESLQSENDALRKEILIRDAQSGYVVPNTGCTCCRNHHR